MGRRNGRFLLTLPPSLINMVTTILDLRAFSPGKADLTKGLIDAALRELAAIEDDVDASRDILERTSHALLHRPALGGTLVARICAARTSIEVLEPLQNLLDVALDTARIAQENKRECGRSFLKSAEEAVSLAANQGQLGDMQRLLLARCWVRNGRAGREAVSRPCQTVPR
jgi:hypothetical protein